MFFLKKKITSHRQTESGITEPLHVTATHLPGTATVTARIQDYSNDDDGHEDEQ